MTEITTKYRRDYLRLVLPSIVYKATFTVISYSKTNFNQILCDYFSRNFSSSFFILHSKLKTYFFHKAFD